MTKLNRMLPLALAAGILMFLGTRAYGHDVMTKAVATAPASQAAFEPSDPKPAGATPGTASEMRDYGSRQSRNPGLSEFAGGHDDDVIIVAGCGCGGLLIAILILVILL